MIRVKSNHTIVKKMLNNSRLIEFVGDKCYDKYKEK